MGDCIVGYVKHDAEKLVTWCLASSEQRMWAGYVKLEMTQDNERLMIIGGGPAYSMATSE